jgi:hypothetical protein
MYSSVVQQNNSTTLEGSKNHQGTPKNDTKIDTQADTTTPKDTQT